ncbi:heparinase II/III family protein, partial [candidate division KSB1 bacterium]|nr:heparinase II/III family protein [candidate division KSB1 bacterium]
MALSDQQLREIIPPPHVPRASASDFAGCPEHGIEIFTRGSDPWTIDPFRDPWKVVCSMGGERYPSHDFSAFLASGLRDSSLLQGKQIDSGGGWQDPKTGTRHCFTAHYCRKLWLDTIVPGTLALSRAYLLTGDPVYAHKAAILLGRIADFYPHMSFTDQSCSADHKRAAMPGRILEAAEEVGLARDLTKAFSNILPASVENESHIRSHLLQEFVVGLFDGRIRGAFGSHQLAALTLACVVDDSLEQDRLIEFALNGMPDDPSVTGLEQGLADFFYREGIPRNSLAAFGIAQSIDLVDCHGLLNKLGLAAFDDPRLAELVLFPHRMLAIDRFHPAIGEFGTVNGGRMDLPLRTVRQVYPAFPTPESAFALLKKMQVEGAFTEFADLFHEPLSIDALEAKAASATVGRRSEVLCGYGLGVLRDQQTPQSLAATLYYGGSETGYGHFDRLSIELFAMGKKLTPDLGTPSSEAFMPDPAAWERNTLSHNTVVVDQRRQTNRRAGHLDYFATSPNVQWVAATAPSVYPDTVTQYRRHLLLIDPPTGLPFFIDLFAVSGGQTHDYSLHGFAGKVKSEKILWERHRGTLAGEDVGLYVLYDDRRLRQTTDPRLLQTYRGGGYSYLDDVRRGYPDGDWSFRWQHDDTLLTLYMPQNQWQQLYWCKGRAPRQPGNPEKLDFLIVRDQSAEPPLVTLFTAVMQGSLDNPEIETVRELPFTGSRSAFSVALEINRRKAGKIVVLANDNPLDWVRTEKFAFRGSMAFLFYDRQDELEQIDFFNLLNYLTDYTVLEGQGEFVGEIASCDYHRDIFTVAPKDSVLRGDLVGKIAVGGNDLHTTAFRIKTAEWEDGQVRLQTHSRALFSGLLPEGDKINADGRVHLSASQSLPSGEKVMQIMQLGAGDRIKIDSWVRIKREADSYWEAVGDLNRVRGVFSGTPIQIN